jgi:hypothetical protein
MIDYERELSEIDDRIQAILFNIIDDIGDLNECDESHPLRRSLELATEMVAAYESVTERW